MVWYFGWGGIQGVGFIWVSVAAFGFAPPSTLSSCIPPFFDFWPGLTFFLFHSSRVHYLSSHLVRRALFIVFIPITHTQAHMQT